VIIISEAIDDLASFNFEYKLQETFALYYWPAGLAAVLFLMTICVAICIFFPLSLMAKNHVNETSNKWRLSAYNMMIEMKKAQKDHEEYLANDGRMPKGRKAPMMIEDDQKPGKSKPNKV